jgi:hypothetical protein
MTRRLLAPVVLLLVVLAACGGDDDENRADTTSATTATTVFNADRARAEITAMWTKQFREGVTVDEAIAHLEHGESYRDALAQQKSTGSTKGLTVAVKDVQVSSPTEATVTYDILINGSVVLPNTTGQAKYIDGGWKVGEKHFCALISAANIHPPACEKVLSG